MTGALRVGWCPGALRPMMAGDGFLVRVKPLGQRLSVAAARRIAALAQQLGNGALTLTARGNLQIRGVGAAGLDYLTAELATLGLLDETPDGEAVRNVLTTPFAAPDAAASRVAAALEAALSAKPALWRLPPKFAWLVDDRAAPALEGIAADVRIEVVPGSIALRLAGGRHRASCPAGESAAVAGRLATTFLSLCAGHGLAPHRMRDLVAVTGDAPILAAAGLAPQAAPIGRAAPPPVAVGRLRPDAVGAAPPFGLLDAATLDAIAAQAEQAGAVDLRLTPWRSLLVTGLAEPAAAALLAGFQAAGLIVDPADRRLAVAACVGAPACHRGTTPVPADAARLAGALPIPPPGGRVPGGQTIQLHVSGCAKGCAHPGPATFTLVGQAGAYDVVQNGRPGDAPRFTGLPVDALVARLPLPTEPQA